jgi:sugar transferase EpsL
MSSKIGSSLALKRAVDVIGAGLTAVALSPVLLAVAALVWAIHGRPILFRQQRPGKDARPFEMMKFRTMRSASGPGPLASDEQRLTRFGRALRATSLDELPELWNVIKGEMSLVGPRPLLMQYLPLYSPAQARRHAVKPGLTGWAQVNGRNALSWERKFELDVWYVENRTIGLDIRILWMTVFKVLQRKSIAAEGFATMPFFTGSQGQAGGETSDDDASAAPRTPN